MKIEKLFIIFVLSGMWGCNGKSVSVVSKEADNASVLVEGEIDDPVRLSSSEFEPDELSGAKLKSDHGMEEYLFSYFPDGNYVLLDDPLDVNFRNINFAVHYIHESLEICDIAIGFTNGNGIFQTCLLIKDFYFVNGDDSILYDFSRGYDGIYGFNISYSYPKAPGYTPGLNIDTYFDNGNRVADTFTIRWNEEKKMFEEEKWF
jgi:hypothetical protein